MSVNCQLGFIMDENMINSDKNTFNWEIQKISKLF